MDPPHGLDLDARGRPGARGFERHDPEPGRRRGPSGRSRRQEGPMATPERSMAIKRRAFLRTSAAAAGTALVGGLPGILAAQKPPSFPKGTKLHLLEWVSFVPAADTELKHQADEFG